MEFIFKEEKSDEIIGVGDLVKEIIFEEDNAFGIVVEQGHNFNVVTFDSEDKEVYVNYNDNGISFDKLQKNYKLVSKSTDVKITFEY